MLMEMSPIALRSQNCDQSLAPNYFNSFFVEQACNDNDADDAAEMRYIQNHYKTKIELMPRMYTGYVMQAKDFLGPAYF